MRAERLALEPIVDRCCHSDDGSDCFREGNAYRVRLWGGLPDGWAGNFALHACALGLEIVSGEAICVDSARWAATFVVRTADPRARMARHDFLTWRGALRASYRRCPSRTSKSLCRKHTAGAP